MSRLNPKSTSPTQDDPQLATSDAHLAGLQTVGIMFESTWQGCAAITGLLISSNGEKAEKRPNKTRAVAVGRNNTKGSSAATKWKAERRILRGAKSVPRQLLRPKRCSTPSQHLFWKPQPNRSPVTSARAIQLAKKSSLCGCPLGTKGARGVSLRESGHLLGFHAIRKQAVQNVQNRNMSEVQRGALSLTLVGILGPDIVDIEEHRDP